MKCQQNLERVDIYVRCIRNRRVEISSPIPQPVGKPNPYAFNRCRDDFSYTGGILSARKRITDYSSLAPAEQHMSRWGMYDRLRNRSTYELSSNLHYYAPSDNSLI